MAQITRTFLSGKMDIDIDDRLIQPGTYRRGQNISVLRSDNADVGAVENIRGNREISPGSLQLNESYVVLGSVADRLNKRIYYFFVGPQTEGIYELDISEDEDGNPRDTINRIMEFSISKQIFRFRTSHFITGVNVIGELLVWNDGLNPPRKINIERFRGSGNYYLPSVDRDDDGLPVYTIVDIPLQDGGTITRSVKSNADGANARLLSDIDPEYDGDGQALINLQTDLYGSGNVSHGTPEEQLAFPGDLISLGKRPPLMPPIICDVRSDVKPAPGFNLRDKFVYAAYRYKYRDGEVTPLSPFSQPIFTPNPYRQPSTDPGEFKSMYNSMSAANIVVDVGSEEVTEVEVYITEGLGRPIRRLENIVKKGGNDDGTDIASSTPYIPSTFSILYDNNKTYSVLPADQANYIFSDIPLAAKAQEFAGNRLVMGNYTRNYSLTTIDENGNDIVPKFDIRIDEGRSGFRDATRNSPAKTVKSDRQIEAGIVYLDAEGRQSSVLSSQGDTAEIPFNLSGQQTLLEMEVDSPAPYWAKYARVFFKNTIGRFNNLFPIECRRDTFNKRLYMRINQSELNKIDADSSIVLKSINGTAQTTRIEYKLAPYIEGGDNNGSSFRLERNDDGELELTGGVNDFTNSFTVPFDTAQANTGNGFANVQTASRNGSMTFDSNQTDTFDISSDIEDSWVNVRIGTVTLNGLVVYNTIFSEANRTLTVPGIPQSGGNITYVIHYTDEGVVAEEAEDAYLVYEPVIEAGGLDPFPAGQGITSAIFETVDTTTNAFDDAIYYEWGQTFRCINGAHTTSESNVVYPADKIQELYEVKGTGTTADIVANNSEVRVNQLTTDLDTGIYTIQYLTQVGTTTEIIVRDVEYVRTNETSGTFTFPSNQDFQANVELTVIDNLPIGANVGDSRDSVILPLDYFNCYSYQTGIEEINIGGAFNSSMLSPGIRASVANEDYRRREQIAHVIHSGIFNDDTTLNRLNEFNRNNQIEWELEINDGSIQKLHARDTNLIAFQENKVKNIPLNKNLIQSVNGQLTTTRSPNFFNTERSYEGEYGISTNPESFSTYGSRIYFADKNRGALLRLAGNGIEEISQLGAESYVRETIKDADLIVSSYDYNKDQAHFTFRNRPAQPEQGSNNGTFVISLKSDEDPRTACNIVANPLCDNIQEDCRSVEDLGFQRIYTRQETYSLNELPLRGLQLGDAVFSNTERTLPFNGNFRWHLIRHEHTGTLGNEDYFPPNNITIQISPDGFITGIERDCQTNRPPDLARELFAISQERFISMYEACASGSVTGVAFHDGTNDEPVIGDTLYAGRHSIIPLPVTGFYLITEGLEKYVIEVNNGLVVDKQDCEKLSRNRTMALGSHPVLIPFGTSPALRNQIICQAPWAEEVYWFDAEYDLPRVGENLYEDDHTDNLVYAPWDATRTYEVLAGGGQYVSHNGATWSAFAENVNSEPALDNTDWVRVSGNIFIVFNNGYFCVLNTEGMVITYGLCSEVLCFKNPDDFIEKAPGDNQYEFEFNGIDAVYTKSATGTLTQRLAVPIGVLNAEINYVIHGRNRYPETGSMSVNAERVDGSVFYSPVLDTANVAEVIGGRDIEFIDLEPGTVFTLPKPGDMDASHPVDPRYAFENEDDVFVDITALCYRGTVNVTIGDQLDIIPDSPVVTVSGDPVQQEVLLNIDLTSTVIEGDGTVDLYEWTIPDGVTIVTGDVNTPNITITSAAPGTYPITLRVTDTFLRTDSFTISKTFYNPTPDIPPTATVDGPSNGTVGVPFTYTGTATDTDATIVSWAWTTTPLAGDFGTPDALTTTSTLSGSGATPGDVTFTATDAGDYRITLTVTDSQGLTGFASKTIAVMEVPNMPPTVTIAASNQNVDLVNDADQNVTISGTATDADGTVASWAYTLEDGLTIVSGDTSGTVPVTDLVITSDLAGTYTIRLTAIDNDGDQSSQEIDVTWFTGNAPPTASIDGPTDGNTEDTFNLTGSGSDTDGTIVSWEWNLPDNVATTSTLSGNSATVGPVALTIPLRGLYPIRLTVEDDGGLTNTATHNIDVVDPPANVPPSIDTLVATPATAEAVVDTIEVTATASDTDGTVESYVWNLGGTGLQTTDSLSGSGISGSSVTIPSITVSGPQGTHTVTLTVRDNDGDDTSQGVNLTFTAQGIPPIVTVTNDTGGAVVPINTPVVYNGSFEIQTSGATPASYLWELADNVTLISGTLSGSLSSGDTTVPSITVSSNVESAQGVTLYVTDSENVTGQGTLSFTPDSGVLPDNIGDYYITDNKVTDAELAATCGGAGSAQTANNRVYYDLDITPIRLWENQSLTDEFDGTAGNYGAAPGAEEGGAVITEIWTISDNGTVTGTTSRSCDVPYPFSLGYTEGGTSAEQQTACQSPSTTPVFSDQPLENFSSDDANPCTILRELNGAGTSLINAPDGYYTDGTVVRRSIGGVLQTNSDAGCSLAKIATVTNGALPTNTSVQYSPSSGQDFGLVGEAYSVTATLQGTGNFAVSNVQWTASDGSSGTGAFEFSGTFEAGPNPSIVVTFTATVTQTTGFSASLSVNQTNSNVTPTGNNTDSSTGLALNQSYNNDLVFTANNGFRFVTNPSLPSVHSDVTITQSSDRKTITFTQAGTISGNANRSYTLSAATEAIPTTGTASLTATTNIANTSVSLSGGSVNGNTVTASGNIGSSFSLVADLSANTGFVLTQVNQADPFTHSGTFTESPQNETVVFTGTSASNNFDAFSGNTPLAACEDTSASTFHADAASLASATILYADSSASSQYATDIYLRSSAEPDTVRFWDASAGAFGADQSCEGEVVTVYTEVTNLFGVESTASAACATGTPITLYGTHFNIGTTETLRKGPFATSAFADEGYYRQGTFYRYWSGTSWAGANATNCNRVQFDGGPGQISSVISGAPPWR